jgi:D-glycero-alpha-D-manno-heptose-7-phosphate kinase
MTRDFVFVGEGTPRDEALKLLNAQIKVVPVLDEAGRLVDVVGGGRAQADATPRLARARAPVRLSLAGGGTDFTNFFMRFGGVSLTASVAQYCHATLRRRDDRTITIYSHDLRTRAEAADIDALAYDGTLDLIKAGIKVLRPEFGFDLEIASDFPPASGLGGSAAVLAATIGCLNEFRDERLDNYTIAECAFEAERVELNIAGGWQDQYSTVFGGFNFIEFDRDHNVVTPLRLAPATVAELEERLLFCHTGRAHLGSAIQDKNSELAEDEGSATAYAEAVKGVAAAMKSRLLRGKLDDFGRLLDETWRIKKSYRPEVTTPALDDIYRIARAAGAEGGRLLGTGGGGFFVFYAPPFARYRVAAALEDKGVRTMNVVVDHEGLRSWTARA